MPELRKDPFTNRWVIIAAERAKRPIGLTRPNDDPGSASTCPFCPGRESMTPPEVFAYRETDSPKDAPGWWLRVVPNRFPALDREGEATREAEGIYDKMEGVGVHDIVVENPDHEATLGCMPRFYVTQLIAAFQQRMDSLQKNEKLRYILIFRNFGRAAGASLRHPHSQIMGLPIVPKRVSEELEGSAHYFDEKERCIYCDILRQEQKNAGRRILFENDLFTALCPFASRFPFETHIYPKKHSPNFKSLDSLATELFAESLQQVAGKLEETLHRAPYNLVFQIAPQVWKRDPTPFFHWRLEILPRVTSFAGFEWGTGFYINPTPPESAARMLRKALVFSPREAKKDES